MGMGNFNDKYGIGCLETICMIISIVIMGTVVIWSYHLNIFFGLIMTIALLIILKRNENEHSRNS